MHIAVCGQLGAGCTEVGEILSRMLGLKCVNSSDIIKDLVISFKGVHPDEGFKEFEMHVQKGEINLDKMIEGQIDEMLEEEETIIEGRSAFMLLNNEDAFKVVQRPEGWSVFVGEKNPSSGAAYFLKSTEEVEELLARLIELK